MSKLSDQSLAGTPRPDVPHSWMLSTWPPSVWPNEKNRARWVLRANRGDLLAEGALARSGKTLIVLGRGYARWLAKRTAYVADFESNNPRIGARAESPA